MERALNKAEVLFDEPCMGTRWPTGMLPGRESWSLYLSVLYPIRVSPSITPSIQRMRTAFAKLHAPSRPLFTLLTASLSSSSSSSSSSSLSLSLPSLLNPSIMTTHFHSFFLKTHSSTLTTKQVFCCCLSKQTHMAVMLIWCHCSMTKRVLKIKENFLY